MSKFLCIPRIMGKAIGDEEIKSRIRRIGSLCTVHNSSKKRPRARYDEALRLLIDTLRYVERYQLQRAGSHDIASCSIKILSYYEDQSHKFDGLWDWKRRRDYKMALLCYHNLLSFFLPEESREIVESLLEAIHEERIWHREHLRWELARGLLEQNVGGDTIVTALLNRVEDSNTDRDDARDIVRLLYEILDACTTWPRSAETVATIERLLTVYRASLRGIRIDDEPPYAQLGRALEVCVRNGIKNFGNEHRLVIVYRMCAWSIDDETREARILDFGSTLEYAAHMHDTHLYRDTLTSNIFAILMRMISSPSRLVSLLGNRVMHHLLDRHDNRSNFRTPIIFFENTSFDIRVNPCGKEDKYFLQSNREVFHDSLVNGMMRHSATRTNLESVYRTMCLIAVEIPCGFTAAALVCLVMNIQELILGQTEMSRNVSYHVHATVIAIMSLLCWIHDARVFYAYVNKIIMRRAQWAPHLNPPIKSCYSFAMHHVLWDKPELFFVDWEVRYGLWKCFRLRKERRSSTDERTGEAQRDSIKRS